MPPQRIHLIDRALRRLILGLWLFLLLPERSQASAQCHEVFASRALPTVNLQPQRDYFERFTSGYAALMQARKGAIKELRVEANDLVDSHDIFTSFPAQELHKRYAGFIVPKNSPTSSLINRLLALMHEQASTSTHPLRLSSQEAEFLNYIVGRNRFQVHQLLRAEDILELRLGASFRIAINFANIVYSPQWGHSKVNGSDVVQGALEGLTMALNNPGLRRKLIVDELDSESPITLTTGAYKFMFKPGTLALIESLMLEDHNPGRAMVWTDPDGHSRQSLRLYRQYTGYLKLRNLAKSLTLNSNRLPQVVLQAKELDLEIDVDLYRQDMTSGQVWHENTAAEFVARYFRPLSESSEVWMSYWLINYGLLEQPMSLEALLAVNERTLARLEANRRLAPELVYDLEALRSSKSGKSSESYLLSSTSTALLGLLSAVYGDQNVRHIHMQSQMGHPIQIQGLKNGSTASRQRQVAVLLASVGYFSGGSPLGHAAIGRLFSPNLTRERVRQIYEFAVANVGKKLQLIEPAF